MEKAMTDAGARVGAAASPYEQISERAASFGVAISPVLALP